MEPIKLTLKSNTVPITLERDGQEPLQLELREMDAASRDHYLDQLSGRMRYGEDGKPAGLKKFDGMQAELLGLCLFDAATGKKVIAPEIQKWPASAVTALFKAAQEMNHLNQAQESPAKNV